MACIGGNIAVVEMLLDAGVMYLIYIKYGTNDVDENGENGENGDDWGPYRWAV